MPKQIIAFVILQFQNHTSSMSQESDCISKWLMSTRLISDLPQGCSKLIISAFSGRPQFLPPLGCPQYICSEIQIQFTCNQYDILYDSSLFSGFYDIIQM